MIGCPHCNDKTNCCLQDFTAPTSLSLGEQKNTVKDFESAAFMRFVKDIGLPQMFSSLTDPRDLSRITYSLNSLCLWAFYTCAFRQGSKNAMQTTIDAMDNQEAISQLFDVGKEEVPCSTTVDNALARIESGEFNDLLLQLFDRIIERKISYNNQEVFLPYGSYQIGVDGFWTHHYNHPHSVNENGENHCPYCLPRVHNRGKENEFITWTHVMVTFVLICEGITLPLYVYPLKANQIGNSQSDEKLKEECERTAAHAVLPLLRKRYPRLALTFFGDALYANKPFIRLCQQLGIDYIIVLKEGSQKNLLKRCDELAKTEFYQKHYTAQQMEKQGGHTILRKGAWFNSVEMGDDIFTNVLRFEETVVKSDGTTEKMYRGAWICSKKIFLNNWFKMTKRGRSRWFQEDMHNTLKNRDFNIEHDMAKANPNLHMVWKMITFIAFFMNELFNATCIAQKIRKKRSIMKFARDMLQQFVVLPWKVISESPILKRERVQFRFDFGFS